MLVHSYEDIPVGLAFSGNALPRFTALANFLFHKQGQFPYQIFFRYLGHQTKR
jgi:hypothetical protein